MRRKYLYSATCRDCVKIGISTYPWLRVRMLLLPSAAVRSIPKGLKGRKCVIARVVKGTNAEESGLHKRLSAYRICGEWYRSACLSDAQYREIFDARDAVSELECKPPGHLLKRISCPDMRVPGRKREKRLAGTGMPDDLHRKLKKVSASTGMRMRAIVIKAIRNYLPSLEAAQ